MNKLFTMFIQVNLSTYWQTFWILYINEDRLCWWFLSLNQRERRNEAITLVDSPRFLLNWRHSLTSLLLCPPAPPLFLSSFKCKGVVDLAACYVVTIMLLAICDPFHFMSWTSWGSSQRGQSFWGSGVLKLILGHHCLNWRPFSCSRLRQWLLKKLDVWINLALWPWFCPFANFSSNDNTAKQ